MTTSRTRASQAQTRTVASNSFRKGLMFAASAGILAVAMPSAGVYGTRAFAQALPDDCEDTNPADPNNLNVGNGRADAGETIECVQSDPNQPLDRIVTTIDDLTLTIGDGVTPTTTVLTQPNGTVRAVYMDGSGDQTVTIESQATLNGVVPADGETPDGETPDGETPDGETPDGETPDGETPDGETPDGETPDGETPDGETPDGETPDGETPDGEGETPDGEGETPEPKPEPEPVLVSPKEIAPSGLMAAMGASELFTDALMQRSVEDDVDGEGFTFFGGGMGGRTRVGNGNGVSGWNGGTGGFLMGASKAFTINGAEVDLGIAAGQSTSDLDSGPSHSEIENFHIGAFASTEIDALSLSAATSYTWHDFDFERVIVSGNQVLVADGRTDGGTWAVQAEAFYDLAWQGETYDGPSLSLGPLLTLDNTLGRIDGFKETNAAILNLTYESETARQTTVGAGLMAGFENVYVSEMRVDTALRVVAEAVDGDLAIDMDAAIAPVDGAVFSPRSAKLDAQRLSLGLHTKVQISDQVFGYVRYDTKRGKNLIENEGWAGITLTF